MPHFLQPGVQPDMSCGQCNHLNKHQIYTSRLNLTPGTNVNALTAKALMFSILYRRLESLSFLAGHLTALPLKKENNDGDDIMLK